MYQIPMILNFSTRIFHFWRNPPFRNLLRSHPFYSMSFPQIFRECSNQKAFEPGMQAHARMIVSGFKPTVFYAIDLLHMYIECSRLECAAKVFDKMSDRNCVSFWAGMISGYSINGKMELAQSLFDLMPERNVVSWTCLMSGYLHNGNCLKSVEVFAMMGRHAVAYNEAALSVVLEACGVLKDDVVGAQVHGVVVKSGFESDVVIGTAVLDMYSKSWNGMIAGSVENGELEGGVELFKEILREGVGFDKCVYASVFKSCASLSDSRLGSQLHGHALKSNVGDDTIVGTAILDMYAKCDDLLNARKVFNLLPNPNFQSYNALIVGYVRGRSGFEGMQLFLLLLNSDLGFNEISLYAAFNVCAVSKELSVGTQIHGLAIKTPFHDFSNVRRAIVEMYCKCGIVEEALKLHQGMEEQTLSLWNAIISGYSSTKRSVKAQKYFCRMLEMGIRPNNFTYAAVLSSCSNVSNVGFGKQIHARVIKQELQSNVYVVCTLYNMYRKCWMVEEAEKLHKRMEERMLVSWNAIISGYSSTEPERAQKSFSRMLEMGIKPDNFTYASVLKTCSKVANVGLGKQIHAQIIKQQLQSDAYIIATLVDMYSKCGNIQDSVLMFQKSSNRDLVTWNTMVFAYARHGYGNEAVRVFEKMLLKKVRPDHVTFVGVLRACTYIDLVHEALGYLHVMKTEFGLEPELEHYSCMVDALGRCGRFTDALKLIEDMPLKADDSIWRSVLSNCRIHSNVEVAEMAASFLIQLDPRDHTAYVLLSHVYADAGMWDEASKIRRMLSKRRRMFKKEVGCSWIEVSSL